MSPSFQVGIVSIVPYFLSFVAALLIGIPLGRVLWRKLHENEALKYEFITIIAHKFRTPLTQVRWLSEAMVNDEQDPYKKENLQTIKTVNQRLISLTNTLIELTDSDNASRTSYQFERVNLCDFVKTTADQLKDAFHAKNLFFSVQCAIPEIPVKIDRARMEFVLQTLLDNAIIYTPPGKNIEVTIAADKHHATVSVIDHGIGIDPADMPRIFSKFFRAPNAQTVDTEGFGVGLYLAQAVVRRHKGKLEAYSAGRDQGSAFAITLPLSS